MIKLAGEVARIARNNPNELVGRRFVLLKELRNNKPWINSSLEALVVLYRTAAIHQKWGRDFTQFLNQHTQLHCWELSYWRFRAILNNDLISRSAVDEFVAHINQRHLLNGDIVLLSELVRFFPTGYTEFDTHKTIRQAIVGIIIDNIRLLSLSQLERMVGTLQLSAVPEADSLIDSIKQSLQGNIHATLRIGSMGNLLQARQSVESDSPQHPEA